MNRIIQSIYSNISHVFKGRTRIPGVLSDTVRWHSQENAVTEDSIKSVLQKRFPNSQSITVEDVSGGCGAMFNVYIETSEFKGLSIPKQHRVVYDSLNEQIKNIHGLHLETKAV